MLDLTARRRAGLILAGALIATATTALAANPVRTENVEAELTAEGAAVPGQTLWIAKTQRIRSGWHTYWINPGDSGIATSINWELPEGWQAGDIVWPAPERFPIGPLVNFGYKDEVHLLVPVTVPETAVPGETVTLTANADWLVCEDICIPESAVLTLDVPVAAEPAQPSPEAAALFAEARASLPVPSPVQANFTAGPDAHELRLELPDLGSGRVESAFFFPEHWAVTPANGEQSFEAGPDGLRLTMPALPGTEMPETVTGVLVLTENLDGGQPVRQALAISAPVRKDAAAAASPAGGATGGASGGGEPAMTQAAMDTAATGLLGALLLAMLGGALLNLMPCVFPVLSMKALALIRHDAAHARTHGLAYTAGVLVCFAAVAGALIALRAGGAQIGWGFQLQDPLVVGILAYVMFLLGLWMSGVYSLGGRVQGVGHSLATRGGYAGSFFTGVLATVVATPCTAPFMGTAIGFALLQPWAVSLSVFLALGLGMALPFLALTWSPALLRRLPRPGLWMDRVKQALAFPLYATAVWLVWVLSIQAGPNAVAAVLGGMVLLGFGAWLFGVTRESPGMWRTGGSVLAGIALVLALVTTAQVPAVATPASGLTPGVKDAKADHEPFSEARLEELRAEGRPVFVNFTAAWCITCLVNENTSLGSASVKQAMAERGVVYLKGDWTNRDAEIARVLERFGRNGVPLYLLYRPGEAEPEVLPQLLTEGIVLEALAKAPAGA
ncbi:protein-disulfide reductase DsbD family protein [Indioceanicola profundi]|uniref:protein-disulfide reductase DsbD family protein n=1 Tax=Indioceanicola profundi TaxID=2220096 RepID=UPI000E6AC31C|nr:protein-disulfide reductase DsbD domain-containing protein [Indioceanicola profundi]